MVLVSLRDLTNTISVIRPQELAELHRLMAAMKLSDHGASLEVERGEQVSCCRDAHSPELTQAWLARIGKKRLTPIENG
jgi:hypothetical protein